ncbi:putative RNA methyltransferase [Salinicola avicenniae]|uniref:putative RNA methyltransferase n=1 Tax=Salinicola avicenniae TaxID=2916836 RepID=UPI0035B55DB9
MTIMPLDALTCPLDGNPLHADSDARRWSCAHGHSFDTARQGYVNLLPVQKKRSRDPGDSQAMVAARQRFLDAGHYAPIAQAVSRLAREGLVRQGLGREGLAPGAPGRCLDAGCGEGYYLRALAADAEAQGQALSLLGLDISKWAVLAAAKRDKRMRWIVGSNAALPVPNAGLDSLLCLFGFPVYDEFARALAPGGMLLQADAGPDHLRELREIIYPTLKPPRVDETQPPAGFSALTPETLRYSLALEDRETIADLLTMTPHLYRASAEGRERAAALTSITLTVEVRIRRWIRD